MSSPHLSSRTLDQGFCHSACIHCGQHVEFPENGIGARIACPACGQETVLEPLAEQREGEAETLSAGELQKALLADIKRPRISFLYQLGLLVVAGFMLILPIAYVALTLALAYGVYWYAVNAVSIVSVPGGGLYGTIIKVVLYLAPILGGGVAVLFMFKPVFARNPKRSVPLELDPAVHPRVYQLISHISDLLRVRMPARIEMVAEVGAYAGFQSGWRSFLGRDLVLGIGLPLVAGLDTRQLAGVIAHELGHCTQAMAMRWMHIIHSVNGWFGRVVYERDSWDEALQEWSDEADSLIVSGVVVCANAAVGGSRLLLKLLMFMGHAGMCFLSRQMEYHADLCSIRIAGSAAVESSLLRSRELNLLKWVAYERMAFFWEQKRKLPESLPQFLDLLESVAPPDFREQSTQTLLNERAGIFSTHPTPAQRIRHARLNAEAGVFVLDRPARILFSNFEEISRTVTARHYLRFMRLPVTPAMLRPVDEFVPGE